MNPAVLLLAAGASRRYDGVKALAPFRDSHLLGWTLSQLQALGEVTIVLGAHAEILSSAIPVTVTQRINEDWLSGQASSLRVGVQALPAHCSAVLIALLDQPAVQSDDYAKLIAAWREAPEQICAARYGGRLGAPAIFPRTFFSALMALQGDQGARMLLQTEGTRALDLPAAAHDIDTPEDWENLTALFRGGHAHD